MKNLIFVAFIPSWIIGIIASFIITPFIAGFNTGSEMYIKLIDWTDK